MKTRKYDYPVVEKLPEHALSIKSFAELKNISTAHVYKMQRLGQLAEKNVQIVVYQGYNFVINIENN